MRLKDHIGKLNYFCAVAESKSIKSASAKVYIGQPQLTKVVKQLEEVLGTPLIVRSTKGITLTQAGDQLYSYAKRVLSDVDEAEFSIKSRGEKIEGHIRIGTYDSIARYFFPDFIKYLQSTIPNVRVDLTTGRSQNLLDDLHQKKLDIAVVVAEPGVSGGFTYQSVYSDSFGLYKNPNLEKSFQENLIYFPFTDSWDFDGFTEYGLRQLTKCDNLETVKALTEQSIGVGLLPHRVARQSLASNQLVPFEHERLGSNQFSPHQVSMCYSSASPSNMRSYFVGETQRFLQIWHQTSN